MSGFVGLGPHHSITAGQATGPGTALDNTIAKADHSLFVVSGTGVSAGVVTLQGSNDGTDWFTTSCTVTTNAASSVFAAALADFPFRHLRANITTAITGGTVDAYVASA